MGLVEKRSMTVLVSRAPGFLPRTFRRGKKQAPLRHQHHMTLHTSPGTSCGSGSPADARTWRRCRLLEAGLPAGLADTVAADPAFDLHVLLQLLDRGCSPDLAVRITTPLHGDVVP
jgi:hypothetical protein